LIILCNRTNLPASSDTLAKYLRPKNPHHQNWLKI